MNERPFSIIVACDVDGGIGFENSIPWKIKSDLRLFRNITTHGALRHGAQPPSKMNAVIMGRNTWESLPDAFRPLPNRINIVVTSQPLTGPTVASSLQEALELAYGKECPQTFVIGGAKLYEEAIGREDLETIHLTKILTKFKCDRFFPISRVSEFPLKKKSEIIVDDSGHCCLFLEYSKKETH